MVLKKKLFRLFKDIEINQFYVNASHPFLMTSHTMHHVTVYQQKTIIIYIREKFCLGTEVLIDRFQCLQFVQ